MGTCDWNQQQTLLPSNIFCIRFVVGTPSTQREHVQAGWALVQHEAKVLLDNLYPDL